MEAIKYSDSFMEFLKKKGEDSKIADTLYSERYYPDVMYTTTEQANYLTFRTDGTISYLPNGKEHKLNDNGDWAREGRQNGKPAKVIRKLFTKEGLELFNDSDFEYFANSYKANYSNEGFEFILLEANRIPFVYDMDRCNEGTLGDSCMNGDTEYLDIYKNCKSLQILTLQKDGLLHGRALIWKIGDITLMDRMYVSKDFLYENFLEYGKAKGYWRKNNYKSYNDKTLFVSPSGEVISKNFTIYTETDFDSYPYIDTFSYGDDGSLSNFGGMYTYCDTGGEREGGEDNHYGEVFDDINEKYISEDEAVYLEYGDRQYRGRHTHRDNCVCVENSDNYYHEDDSHIVEVDGTWYEKDDSDICELSNGDFALRGDCEEVGGDYELSENCSYCERDNCYYLTDDCVMDKDGNYILENEAIEVDGEWIHEDDKEEDKEDIENPNQLNLFDDNENKEAA